MLKINVFFKIIFLALLLIENSWAMQNELDNDNDQNILVPIVYFPTSAEILKALNEKTRKIFKGKFEFNIELPSNLTKDFPLDKIIKITMVPKPPKLESYEKGIREKKVNNYEYRWQIENFVVAADFVCFFENHAFRRYTFKISLQLAHVADDTQSVRKLQWTGLFRSSEFFIASNRPLVDGNIMFYNDRNEKIEKIFDHHYSIMKPQKNYWVIRDNKATPGGILVSYPNRSSKKKRLNNKYLFLKEDTEDKWIKYNNSNEKLIPGQDYTPVHSRDKKLSAHIEALYRFLEKKEFSLADLIVAPANEELYMIDFFLNRLHEALFFLEEYQRHFGQEESAQNSPMPRLNKLIQTMNQALEVYDHKQTSFKDALEDDAAHIENILSELQIIVTRVVEADLDIASNSEKEVGKEDECRHYYEWLLFKCFFYRLGLAELGAVLHDHKFLTITDTQQKIIYPKRFSQLKRRELAKMAYAHFYCWGYNPFSKTILIDDQEVHCTFYLKNFCYVERK